MLPLDFLGVPLAWAMHLRGKMPSVRAPMIRIKAREPKGLQPRFPLQKDLILTTPEDIKQLPGNLSRKGCVPIRGEARRVTWDYSYFCSSLLWRPPACGPSNCTLPMMPYPP